MTPLILILGILIISVMNERLVPKLNAPYPVKTDNFLLANFIKIFWLYYYHLWFGIWLISLVLTLIYETDDKSLSTY